MSGAPRFPGQRPPRKPFIDLFNAASSRGLEVGVLFRSLRASTLVLARRDGRGFAAKIPWGHREETRFDPVGDAATPLALAGGFS